MILWSETVNTFERWHCDHRQWALLKEDTAIRDNEHFWKVLLPETVNTSERWQCDLRLAWECLERVKDYGSKLRKKKVQKNLGRDLKSVGEEILEPINLLYVAAFHCNSATFLVVWTCHSSEADLAESREEECNIGHALSTSAVHRKKEIYQDKIHS